MANLVASGLKEIFLKTVLSCSGGKAMITKNNLLALQGLEPEAQSVCLECTALEMLLKNSLLAAYCKKPKRCYTAAP